MADEYVRTGEFGEFVKRMDERFDHVNELANQRFDSINQRFLDVEKRMKQGFTHAEKAREQNFVHLNQRLDGVNQRLDDMNHYLQAEARSLRETMQAGDDSLRRMMLALHLPVVLAILGAAIKYLFFN